MNPEYFTDRLKTGLLYSFSSKKRAFSTLFISFTSFIAIALSTSIGYSTQMFSAGLKYWIPAIIFTVKGIYLNGGISGVALNIAYSGLIGVTVTNTYIQFKNSGLKARNLSGIAPGFVIAGCAGCGIGLLGLIGMTGLLALLPFQGTGVKILGMILITYFIADIGNPEICSIPSS